MSIPHDNFLNVSGSIVNVLDFFLEVASRQIGNQLDSQSFGGN